MRGPAPSYPILLSEQQALDLRQLVRRHKTPHALVQRAQIVLAAAEQPEASNQQIAQQVGCTDRTVRKWRRRWTETHCLNDLPRAGAPRRFSP